MHFSGAPRLARNDGTVRFSGVTHEKIDADDKGQLFFSLAREPSRLLLYIVGRSTSALDAFLFTSQTIYVEYRRVGQYDGALEYKRGATF